MQNKSKLSPKVIKRIFLYIAETGNLMFMKRIHERSLINTFDTVASHAHHVSIIAYCLTRMEGMSHEEGLKAMAMGVLHDNPEMRTGDLDFIAKHYGENNEEKAIEDQLSGLPFAEDLKKLSNEYLERETLISKCAKDADIIEQMYEEWILANLGNKMAEKWFMGDRKERIPRLRTESAKQIAEQLYTSHPHEWWWKDLVEKGINQDFLSGKK